MLSVESSGASATNPQLPSCLSVFGLFSTFALWISLSVLVVVLVPSPQIFVSSRNSRNSVRLSVFDLLSAFGFPPPQISRITFPVSAFCFLLRASHLAPLFA
jgi:hypothetical protein